MGTAWRTALAVAGVALGLATGAAAAPRVVASIQPVHALAASLMEGVGAPYLLVPPGASPHSYALKPSDARAISHAGIVLWIGPQLERFLEAPLERLAAGAQVLELIETPDLNNLRVREGGAFEAHEHDDGSDGEHGHEADGRPHGMELDPHIWLDPRNARVMARAIAAELIAADAANADRYRANADALDRRIAALEDELRARLAPVAGRPFIVFHDAWQHFDRRFGLTAAGSISLNPEAPPGARRIGELRRLVAERGVVCIFREPQFSSRLPETVAEETGARVAVADPLGADLPSGPGHYEALMRRAAEAFRGCLAP